MLRLFIINEKENRDFKQQNRSLTYLRKPLLLQIWPYKLLKTWEKFFVDA